MKRFMMAVAALAFCATMGFSQVRSERKVPFSIDFSKLDTYLKLADYQKIEVSDICDYFVVSQSESMGRNPVLQEKQMKRAIYGNLKLMKNALNEDQYRKYVALLNITNYNNGLKNEAGISDVYMAQY